MLFLLIQSGITFKTKKYTSIFVPTFNTPPRMTAVQSFGEGDSDCDRGKTKSSQDSWIKFLEHQEIYPLPA